MFFFKSYPNLTVVISCFFWGTYWIPLRYLDKDNNSSIWPIFISFLILSAILIKPLILSIKTILNWSHISLIKIISRDNPNVCIGIQARTIQLVSLFQHKPSSLISQLSFKNPRKASPERPNVLRSTSKNIGFALINRRNRNIVDGYETKINNAFLKLMICKLPFLRNK